MNHFVYLDGVIIAWPCAYSVFDGWIEVILIDGRTMRLTGKVTIVKIEKKLDGLKLVD